MELTHTDLPETIRTRTYLKDKPLVYSLGVLHLGAVGLTGYFLYEDTSVFIAVGLMLLLGLFLFSIWYRDFRIRNNVIEITPQYLRIDDCEFKEIPWSDISRLEVVDHFSARLGRFVHLFIYAKNNDKYTFTKKGGFLNRQRADGGIFATDLYNYAEDHKKILRELSEALESSRLIIWPL
ncbi:MAG: hypothetical protein JJ867_02645 [Marinobacter sp.]|nr:hypothetical protein [Marinobacter sp.]